MQKSKYSRREYTKPTHWTKRHDTPKWLITGKVIASISHILIFLTDYGSFLQSKLGFMPPPHISKHAQLPKLKLVIHVWTSPIQPIIRFLHSRCWIFTASYCIRTTTASNGCMNTWMVTASNRISSIDFYYNAVISLWESSGVWKMPGQKSDTL